MLVCSTVSQFPAAQLFYRWESDRLPLVVREGILPLTKIEKPNPTEPNTPWISA